MITDAVQTDYIIQAMPVFILKQTAACPGTIAMGASELDIQFGTLVQLECRQFYSETAAEGM